MRESNEDRPGRLKMNMSGSDQKRHSWPVW